MIIETLGVRVNILNAELSYNSILKSS